VQSASICWCVVAKYLKWIKVDDSMLLHVSILVGFTDAKFETLPRPVSTKFSDAPSSVLTD